MVLDLDLLLKAYRIGVFPMSDSREDPEIFWVEPQTRAIVPLDGFHMARSLAKTLRQDKFHITCNTAFADVIAACAHTSDNHVTPDRRETWINSEIENAYTGLHDAGYAYSIECWQEEKLVGGLYGVAIGRAYFGESMFSHVADASKVALAALVASMRYGGYALLDCQFMTGHLASMGAMEIPQEEYLNLLTQVLYGMDVAQDNGEAESKSYSSSSSAAGAATAGAAGVVAPSLSLPEAFSALVDGLGADGELREDRAGLATSSSPGKRIAHSLTQTS